MSHFSKSLALAVLSARLLARPAQAGSRLSRVRVEPGELTHIYTPSAIYSRDE